MEHPPKQGLKLENFSIRRICHNVLMEHPPKQGLKLDAAVTILQNYVPGFNGTSTKTRIETHFELHVEYQSYCVLMEHPPKQGLKLVTTFWRYATIIVF